MFTFRYKLKLAPPRPLLSTANCFHRWETERKRARPTIWEIALVTPSNKCSHRSSTSSSSTFSLAPNSKRMFCCLKLVRLRSKQMQMKCGKNQFKGGTRGVGYIMKFLNNLQVALHSFLSITIIKTTF